MTRDEYGDHPALDGYPTDSDYCGVEKERADVRDDAQAAESARERFDYGEDASPSSERETAESDAQRPSRSPQESETGASADGPGGDMTHVFGRHAGALAGTDYDHEIDTEAPREHDGRAETRTGFKPWQAPPGERDKWRRLNTLNDDGRHPDRRTQNRSADRRRWIDAFCSTLDMTPYQRERVQHIVAALDMGHMAHYSSQQVILAVVSLVANEDDRWIRDERAYRGLMDDVGASLYQVKRIRKLIRRKSDSV